MRLRSPLGYFGLLLAGSLLFTFSASVQTLAAKANTVSPKVSKVPKCGLVGTWRGNITIPDGADGVSTIVALRFSESGHKVTVSGIANNKPLAIANAMATCTEFSFVIPQGAVPVNFSGKLSDEGHNVSGTAKRQDLATSWSLQRQ